MTAEGWRPLQAPARPATVHVSPFARLVRTHALLMAGDALVAMALAGSLFFSISPTEARGRVALSLVLTMAPFAVVAPLLGPVIDRSKRGRRAIVIASAVGRSVAALVMLEVLDSLLLFPAAFTTLVLAKTYSVAKSALVPSAVRSDDELVEANAKLSMAAALAGFAAAIPGGLLLQVGGSDWVLRLAAVAFLGGGMAAFSLVERDRAQRVDEAIDARAGVRLENEELRGAGIVLAAIVMGVLRAAVGFLTFLIAFEFRRPPSAPTWWFGVVLAVSVASGFLGAVVAPRLRGLLKEEWLLTGSMVLVATAGLILARGSASGTAQLVVASLMAVTVGIGASVGKLAFDSVVQRDAPDAARGRAFARFEALFQLVWVLGALVPVVVATPLRLGVAIIAITAGVSAVAYPLARRRELART